MVGHQRAEMPFSGGRSSDPKAAQEPEHDDNYEDKTENAAQPGSTISPVTVITAAAPEQQDEDDDNQKCAQFISPVSGVSHQDA
jgi:hypothetical protein